jgi:hypothetical protein
MTKGGEWMIDVNTICIAIWIGGAAAAAAGLAFVAGIAFLFWI